MAAFNSLSAKPSGQRLTLGSINGSMIAKKTGSPIRRLAETTLDKPPRGSALRIRTPITQKTLNRGQKPSLNQALEQINSKLSKI